MEKNIYKSALYNSVYNAKLWMMATFGVIVSNVFLAFLVLTADTTEKTIVIPPNANKEFTVRGDFLDPSYLEMMARYHAGLLLNYQRDNINSQHNAFLLSVSPAIYPELSTTLRVKENKVVRNDVSSTFHPLGIHVRDGDVVISGLKIGYIGSKEISRLIRSYEFVYSYAGGALQVVSYKEVEKAPEGGYSSVNSDELIDLNKDDLTEGGSNGESNAN
jgi:conjugal transfer pilus assembly protein TraE